MGLRNYPTLHCIECHAPSRMVAVCEKPDGSEARFYECSNPVCRFSFKSCVPVLSRGDGWIGLRDDVENPVPPS